jgi:hypothetical protein
MVSIEELSEEDLRKYATLQEYIKEQFPQVPRRIVKARQH